MGIDGKTRRGSHFDDLDGAGKPRAEPVQQQLTAVGIDSCAALGQIGFSGKRDAAEAAAQRAVVPSLPPQMALIAYALHIVCGS